MPIQLELFNIFKSGLLLKHPKSEPFLLLTSIGGYFTAFPAAEGPLLLYTSLSQFIPYILAKVMKMN